MHAKKLPNDPHRPNKFANHTNLPHPQLLLTKENLSRSEEETKVSEEEETEWEGREGRECEGREGGRGGRFKGELEAYREEIGEYVLGR